jgi:uncharacterized protein (TIGR03083 family)
VESADDLLGDDLPGDDLPGDELPGDELLGDELLGDDERLAVLASEGALFAATARANDLAAPVPNCPGWTLRDLVAHLGLVHRWVTRVVREERGVGPGRAERRALEDPDPTDGSGLIERTLLAHADLVLALRTAGPELACWTVWPVSCARTFWIRRQLYETLVHRVDAQNSAAARLADGTEPAAHIATDGVDEMVCGFINRYAEHLRFDVAVSIALHATDTDRRWWIRLGPDAPTSGRGPTSSGPADAEVQANAGELFLMLWNRRTADGLHVRGDRSALEVWRRGAHR